MPNRLPFHKNLTVISERDNDEGWVVSLYEEGNPAVLNVMDFQATATGALVSPTDDSAAIQRALNAVPSNGGIVYFPPGSYSVSSTLHITVPGTIIKGSGYGSQIKWSGSALGTCIIADSVGRAFIRDIRISQTDATPAGTAIDASNFSSGVLERVLIDAGGASGVPPLVGIDLNGSNCHYNAIRDCRINYAGASSRGVQVRGTSHSNVLDNLRCIPHVATADAASCGVYVVNAHSSSLHHIDVENAPGNGIFLDTGADATVVMNPYLELNNIGLKISSGVMAPVVLGGTIQASGTANIQDNGAISPRLIATWPNSSTNVVSYENSQGSFDVNGQALGAPQPQNLGLIAWNHDPVADSNNTAPTSGTIYLARVDVARKATVTKLMVGIGVGATTPTAGQNFLALLDSSGTVLQSVNIDSLVTSSGLLVATISQAVTPGAYYVALLQNAATPATVQRGSGNSPVIMNLGLSAATSRFATNGTAQTSITNRTMSSNSNTGAFTMWAAIA